MRALLWLLLVGGHAVTDAGPGPVHPTVTTTETAPVSAPSVSSDSSAQAPGVASSASKNSQSAAIEHAPAPRRAHVIEVTFGSAQLFNHQSIVTKSGHVREEIIPVTSALIMLEWLFHTRFSAISLFNLPLVTQKTVVSGAVREEFVAPSVALGVRASALRLDLFAHSQLDLQLAALGGVTLGSSSGDTIFPVLAGRIHFSNQEGFTLLPGQRFRASQGHGRPALRHRPSLLGRGITSNRSERVDNGGSTYPLSCA